jgi:carbonic anhydrase
MPDNALVHTDFDRRQFLQTVISSAVVGVATQAGIELAAPERLSAQTNLSPDAALQELLAGNQRFAANQLTSIEHDLTILNEHRTLCRGPRLC